ncbi:MAG TPA: FmdB family zinc ribbon protein [Thermoanaerobaculia bacterium]
MPLYEYQCQNCSERVEILQRISDPPYQHCPKCGGEMRKLMSAPAIQFKGSGFYKTDYASSSSSKTESKPAESKSDSSKSSEGSGD